MMEKRKTSRLHIQTLDNNSREDDVDIESSDVIENKRNSHYKNMSTALGVFVMLLVFAVFYFRGSAPPHPLHTVEQQLNILAEARNTAEQQTSIENAIVEIANVKPVSLPVREPEVLVSKSIDIDELHQKCKSMIDELRSMKQHGTVMEIDETAKRRIVELQNQLRILVPLLYGPEPYHVEMKLVFPESMPDYAANGPGGRIVFELGPLALVPYSTYYFLEIIKNWKGGAFHRNAGHVEQAMVHSSSPGLAFQEYNPGFPHKRLTMGYAGRPGGPAFYISTMDNVANHGPASQGSKTEADGCFGKITPGSPSEAVVMRMKKQPGKGPDSGFIMSSKDFIKIESLRVLGPGEA